MAFVKNKMIWLVVAIMVAATAFYLISKTYNNQKLIAKVQQETVGEIIFGAVDARESLIVYFNYNCAFCKKFFTEAFPLLKTKYIDGGKLNVKIRLVCPVGDEAALRAYQTAICINQFGNFELLHKLLMHNNRIMYTDHFTNLIEDYIALNEDVAECIVENKDFRAIRINNQQLYELKTNGTPTFVYGSKVASGYSSFDKLESKLKIDN